MRWTLSASVALALGAAACTAPHEDETRVFVRDPRQVWVEAHTSQGDRLVLPVGEGLRGVSVRAELPPEADGPSKASVFREISGGVTVDHPTCAPWPTNPLSARGELTVHRAHGQDGFSREGQNLVVPYRCQFDGVTTVDLAFVTPLANVREVDVIEDAVDSRVAGGGSSDPVLQAHPWEH